MNRFGGLVITALVFASSTSDAYVRSRTSHGTPTSWRSSCVLVQPDSVGTNDLDATTITATIQASMQAWAAATAACSYLTLSFVTPAVLDAHFDGINTIKFRADKWCHPDDSHSSGVCYSNAAAGITTVYYADRPGESDDGTMLDADVELNDINFTFAIVDPSAPAAIKPRSGTSIADFENTLVHELGHLQGLDHTCKDSSTPATELDETGMAPPSCAALASLSAAARAKITEATMFNSATAGETKKRTPEADDVAGICAAYPIANKPAACSPQSIAGYDGSHGCAFAARPATCVSWFWTSAALSIALLRRRRVRPAR